MSVQFGRWNFDAKEVSPGYFEKVNEIITPFGPDGSTSYNNAGLKIQHYAFHTTKESRRESQPHVAPSGIVLTWDGRLDNRAELMSQLNVDRSNGASDVAIVAEAFDRWGTKCLGKLIGDWALSVWNPADLSLILAKDFVGTRLLYYCLEKDQITWSSLLEPLVKLAGHSFDLDEEYIAGWYSLFPDTHLTPYKGIRSVPPASFVLISTSKATVRAYWSFDSRRRIRYRNDREYEEHFRTVLSESVRRRLRFDAPTLAELSGGMDSSSIVCVADTLIAKGLGETPRLDTVSYVDDSEPNWNERPYFTTVEKNRGRTGYHIDLSSQNVGFDFIGDRFMATPASDADLEATKQFRGWLSTQGYRVLLSGIGGDEVLGGVPTPTPELADLLTRGQLQTLARQLVAWALAKRKPLLHLLYETISAFLPVATIRVPRDRRPAFWLCRGFVKRNRTALEGYPKRIKLLGSLPSLQDDLTTLEALRRQLACSATPFDPVYEKCYPYLDRDLIEFLFSIPPEQLVRPGHRRSLMRRALVGIVPVEVLERKRKACVVRHPLAAISTQWPKLMEMSHQMVSGLLGIVDVNAFCTALEKARHGREVPIVPLMRTIGIEMWLRNLAHCNFLSERSSEGAKQRQDFVGRSLPLARISISLLS
jgi:asparagine synthase (glutamine-hydrolysing)